VAGDRGQRSPRRVGWAAPAREPVAGRSARRSAAAPKPSGVGPGPGSSIGGGTAAVTEAVGAMPPDERAPPPAPDRRPEGLDPTGRPASRQRARAPPLVRGGAPARVRAPSPTRPAAAARCPRRAPARGRSASARPPPTPRSRGFRHADARDAAASVDTPPDGRRARTQHPRFGDPAQQLGAPGTGCQVCRVRCSGAGRAPGGPRARPWSASGPPRPAAAPPVV
jgi:hypothetical protein